MSPAVASLRLRMTATSLDRPSAMAAALRVRGLVFAARSDLDGAVDALERALAQHERVRSAHADGTKRLCQRS